MLRVTFRSNDCHTPTTNDIAIIWPPKQAPIIVVIYFTQYKENAVPRDDIIASVTRLLLGAVKTDD